MDCSYMHAYVSETGQRNPNLRGYVILVKVRDAHVMVLID